MKTQKAFTLSDEALHQLAALTELYQTSTKSLEVAIYSLYQEKRKERRILTTVERKAGIATDDALPIVVAKIKTWVQATIPSEKPSYQKEQALMAFNAVVADRGAGVELSQEVFQKNY